MRDYLNSSQKNQLSFMAAMLAMLTEFDKNNTLSKTEKTEMKYINTYLTKLIKSIFSRIPEVENRVKRDLKDNRVILSPKFSKLNEREYVDLEDLCDLLEMLVSEHCGDCKRDNFVGCAVFKMHQRLQVDVNGGEPDGVCPYGFAYDGILR
jgi:hypothetical protein